MTSRKSCVTVRGRTMTMAVAASVLVGVLAASTARAKFTDVTNSAGITHAQATTIVGMTPAVMTGGVAARDVDGDGWTDLLFTRWDAGPMLYLNDKMGGFTDATAGSGIGSHAYTNGAAFGDIDNDGDADLYLTNAYQGDGAAPARNSHYLYINDGTGQFTEQAVSRNAHIPDVNDNPGDDGATHDARYGTSVSFGDYEGDGYLDIHVNSWGFFSITGDATRLLKNQGQAMPGHFTDETQAAGVSVYNTPAFGPQLGNFSGNWAFTSRFTDLNKDGHQDLVIAGDFETSRAFLNDGDGTFTEILDPVFGTDENGMGLTVGDANGDGIQDIFITSIFHEEPPHPDPGHNNDGNYGVTGNRLYLGNGDGTFTDGTDNGVRDGSWGWGSAFIDYDNDGDLDLAMTNGFPLSVDWQVDQSILWENDGSGQFTNVSNAAGITDNLSGKGLATLDYDMDGDLDMVIVNNNGQPILYRNDTNNGNSYLMLELVGTESNWDGIGAKIEIIADLTQPADVLYREVDGGSNYLSQSDLIAHFGLGSLVGTIDQITITWTSGQVQVLTDVAVNQKLTVTEVPEPAAAALLAAGAIGLLRRRRA